MRRGVVLLFVPHTSGFPPAVHLWLGVGPFEVIDLVCEPQATSAGRIHNHRVQGRDSVQILGVCVGPALEEYLDATCL